MTYELARALKDAGFPQKQGEGGTWIYPDKSSVFVHLEEDEACYVPTLSELMKALPDSCGLQLDDWGWTMYVKGFKRDFTISEEPEEAVAKLWLALQNG